MWHKEQGLVGLKDGEADETDKEDEGDAAVTSVDINFDVDVVDKSALLRPPGGDDDAGGDPSDDTPPAIVLAHDDTDEAESKTAPTLSLEFTDGGDAPADSATTVAVHEPHVPL